MTKTADIPWHQSSSTSSPSRRYPASLTAAGAPMYDVSTLRRKSLDRRRKLDIGCQTDLFPVVFKVLPKPHVPLGSAVALNLTALHCETMDMGLLLCMLCLHTPQLIIQYQIIVLGDRGAAVFKYGTVRGRWMWQYKTELGERNRESVQGFVYGWVLICIVMHVPS